MPRPIGATRWGRPPVNAFRLSFWTLLAALACLPANAADVSLQRYLANLRLGDRMPDIESVYPPKKEWYHFGEPKRGLIRIELERTSAKFFPLEVSRMRLWMRSGKLVCIQLIYDREYSRRKPLDALVTDYAVMYGEPRRSGMKYFWRDRRTALAAVQAQVPSEKGKGTELRTSLELMERGLFKP